MGTYADMIAKHSIPDSKKYKLLTSHFSPGADYNFPQGANKRKFQYKWLCEKMVVFVFPVAFLLPHTMALILAFLLVKVSYTVGTQNGKPNLDYLACLQH